MIMSMLYFAIDQTLKLLLKKPVEPLTGLLEKAWPFIGEPVSGINMKLLRLT